MIYDASLNDVLSLTCHSPLLQLLHLCEAESLSYLDEVASTPRSMDVAKSVALEVGSQDICVAVYSKVGFLLVDEL